GMVLSAAPVIELGWLKPKCSAVATSRLAPSLAPRGANTELHDTAKALISVPPQSSPLAFCSGYPSGVAPGGVGEAGAQRGDVGLQRPGGGDDLHRRARGLERRVGDARCRQHGTG